MALSPSRFDRRTELGAYLDPLADKALLVSIYVSLAICAGLPAWIAIAVVSRDIMILVAVLVSSLMDKPVEIRPVWESKSTQAARSLWPVLRWAGAPMVSIPNPCKPISNGQSRRQPWLQAVFMSPNGSTT